MYFFFKKKQTFLAHKVSQAVLVATIFIALTQHSKDLCLSLFNPAIHWKLPKWDELSGDTCARPRDGSGWDIT